MGPLKFHTGYSGASGKHYAECGAIGYHLSFDTHEAAYFHAKLAEYEFNLIRLKHPIVPRMRPLGMLTEAFEQLERRRIDVRDSSQEASR